MPKAAHTPTTSERRLPASSEGDTPARRPEAPTRRGVLGGAALLSALAAGGVAAAAPSAPAATGAHPDAELLRLIAEAEELDRSTDELHARTDKLPDDDPECRAIQEEIADGVERFHEALEEASEIPARTLEGLRAKARVMKWSCTLAPDGTPSKYSDSHERLRWSLANDILRLEG